MRGRKFSILFQGSWRNSLGFQLISVICLLVILGRFESSEGGAVEEVASMDSGLEGACCKLEELVLSRCENIALGHPRLKPEIKTK